MNIYVMTHKHFQKILPEGYVPLHVGAAFGGDFGYLKDDTGDNISNKNHNYCELTGLYWLWKNTADDIVGLCHYRRYLSLLPFDRKLKFILTRKNIEKRLKKTDIILPFPVFARKTNKELYCESHYEKDYLLTRDTIAEYSPEYLEAFDVVMNKKYCCQCNMFIASKPISDAYCEWLFGLYAELEKKIDLSAYSTYQARMYGFMSERLLNVWVEHNKLSKSFAFFASTELDYKKAVLTIVSGFFHKSQ